MSKEELETKIAEFKTGFGRKKKPQILAISAAGQIGINEMISVIEQQFLKTEQQ